MLEAIATDFAALDNVSVNLMWDTRLERPPAGQIEIAKVCSADEELKTFASLASNCECTLIIAPEIDNWLSSKTRQLKNWTHFYSGRMLILSRSQVIRA